MAHRLSRPLTALLLACLASGAVRAAEMGEARVSSFIGQQLAADIELTSLEDAATMVKARLASPDVYRGASIAMAPVLSSLSMSVMSRDGRQFLHLTSLKPVDADHLHLFLELVDGGQRSVRLATLWLAPDPNPAPPPAPAAVPAPAAAPVRPPAPAIPVRAQVPAATVSAAPLRTLRPAPPRAADAHPAPVRAASPVAAPIPALVALPAAAFPRQIVPVPAPAGACAALDTKSATLREKIVQLEGKVQVLQRAMSAAPAVATARPRQAVPGKTGPRRKPEAGSKFWSWVGIGAAVFAAYGAVVAAIRGWVARKAKKNKAKAPIVITPNVMGGVKSRLMADAPTRPLEPKME